MDSSALIVVVGGTVLFFGFTAWMAFYTRRKAHFEQLKIGPPEPRMANTPERRVEW